jgi:hypothetical protein
MSDDYVKVETEEAIFGNVISSTESTDVAPNLTLSTP